MKRITYDCWILAAVEDAMHLVAEASDVLR